MSLPEGIAASALRQSFPEQADEVLASHGASFRTSEQGFELTEGAEEQRRLVIHLPRDASGAVLIRAKDGFEVRVREIGLEGKGALAEGVIAYRRSGGTSFWKAQAGGAEEWLHLEQGMAHVGKAMATWQVEGATLRQHDEVIEVMDASGWTRLFVTAPAAYAAGGREVKARLELRGEARIELFVDANGEAVLVDPLWAPVGSMGTARQQHTMTRLVDGRVLVVGGSNGSTLATAELYSPANNTWSGAGAMGKLRRGHSATLLNDGRVLVAGGYGRDVAVFGPDPGTEAILSTAEIYNPASNTWSLANTMNGVRWQHTATLLGSGKVLVVGGLNKEGGAVFGPSCDDIYAKTAETYNPLSDKWSTNGAVFGPSAPPPARYLHTATRLDNGKVLVAGGANFCATATENRTAYLFNDTPNPWWEVTGILNASRMSPTATLLADGRVLVAGGNNLTSAETYDAQSGTWTTTLGSLSTARSQHTATLLGNGKVLVAGGFNGTSTLASAELFDPTTTLWTTSESMSNARRMHTATLLGSGSVLLAGGASGASSLATAEEYTGRPFQITRANSCARCSYLNLLLNVGP
jgi:Galactose oxidase, central domain/Kelch motif